MPVTSYSRTPASNNSAPPNGAPEGMTPGSVNNTIRQIMTDIVNEAGKGSARVLGSVAGTNTITAAMSPALDAYTAGMLVVLTPANTNTGATTINIDTLGALDVQQTNGNALIGGELVAGSPALLLLDSGADDFRLVNPAHTGSGTYTPTLTQTTNVSSSGSAQCQYMRVGNVVTVSGIVDVTCTSGTGASTVLGISLPIASNIGFAIHAAGAGQHNSSPVGVQGHVAGDRAEAVWFSSTASSSSLRFTFTYLVI